MSIWLFSGYSREEENQFSSEYLWSLFCLKMAEKRYKVLNKYSSLSIIYIRIFVTTMLCRSLPCRNIALSEM